MRTMQTWVVGLAMSVAALGASAATELRHWPSEAAAAAINAGSSPSMWAAVWTSEPLGVGSFKSHEKTFPLISP